MLSLEKHWTLSISFEEDGQGLKDIYLVPSEVTQSLVVLLLKTTAALELELVLVNRPHLINSYEVGITAGPLACVLLGLLSFAGKISFRGSGYS